MNDVVDPAIIVRWLAATERERSVGHLSTNYDDSQNEVSEWEGLGDVNKTGYWTINVSDKDYHEGNGRCHQRSQHQASMKLQQRKKDKLTSDRTGRNKPAYQFMPIHRHKQATKINTNI